MDTRFRRKLSHSWVSFIFIFCFLSGRALAVDPSLLLGWNGGNNSNPHNLSRLSSNTIKAANTGEAVETEICVFCHIPHGATAQSTLWSRPAPNRTGWPLYDNNRVHVQNDVGGYDLGIDDPDIVATTKYDNTGAYGEYPNGATKLCLSCHDGATAIGTLANGLAISMTQDYITDPTMYFDPPADTAMDFSASHPVSFVYNQDVVDYLMRGTFPGPGAGKLDTYKLPDHSLNSASRTSLDSQDRMQCTTCHDPHVDTRGGGHTYPFWRNAGVGVDDNDDYNITCNECHQSVLYSSGHDIPTFP